MQDKEAFLPICIAALIPPVMGAVGQTPVLPGASDDCMVHMNELVLHLKETANIQGTALRIANDAEGIILKYKDFSQHMRCVDGTLHIDVREESVPPFSKTRPTTFDAH